MLCTASCVYDVRRSWLFSRICIWI